MDTTIKIDFTVYLNHCRYCDIDFSLIAVFDDYWLHQTAVFCPYCGAEIEMPVVSDTKSSSSASGDDYNSAYNSPENMEVNL